MAITLAEAKVGMADKVDQQIVDMFRRSSLLLDQMVFDNVISPGTGGSTLTYGYIQLKTPSTAGARTINDEYTPDEAKKEKKTTNAIIMGGAFQMDRVLQSTSGAASVGGQSAFSWSWGLVPNAPWNTGTLTEGGITYTAWTDLQEGYAIIPRDTGQKRP